MKMLLHWVATVAILNAAGQTADAAESAAQRSTEWVELSAAGEVQGQAPDGRLTVDRTRERLADPEGRPAVRAEQRAYLAEFYVDTEYALGIDAPTREKLLDLLVEELADLDALSPGNPEYHPANQVQMLADAETRHLSALLELLGDKGFERFFAYRMSLAERRQVNLLDKRLDLANKLQPTQKERLIDLLSEQKLQALDATDLSRLSFPPPPVSAEQMLQASKLLTVAANEETWRSMPEVHQRLARQAAAFLTPAQLTVFEDVNAERMRSLQQWIEQARLWLGLDPVIPATPDAPLAAPKQMRTPITAL